MAWRSRKYALAQQDMFIYDRARDDNSRCEDLHRDSARHSARFAQGYIWCYIDMFSPSRHDNASVWVNQVSVEMRKLDEMAFYGYEWSTCTLNLF